MYRGYVKLWRKSLDAGWFKNHQLWVFWSWCLVKASHKEMDIIVGFQKVHLMPGDFIFGRKTASKELNISERSIRTLLHFLQTSQNMTIKATNKYSIISIVNWNIYQSDEIVIDQQPDQPPTSNRPATDQQVTTNKNEENVKNEKKIKSPRLIQPEKTKFLDTVYLTTDEHQKLVTKYGSLPTEKAIEILNNGIMAKGYNYKSHYHAVIGWPMREATGGNNGKGAYAARKDIRGHDVPDETERINAEYYARKAAKEAAANKASGVSKADDVPDFQSS